MQMTEPGPAPSTFNLLQLPDDVQLSMLLAFDIRELIICKSRSSTLIPSPTKMCRSLAGLIDGDISIRYKIELARSGRIDGTPSVAVMVIDRLTSLREHSAKFHAGNHPLKHLRGRPFGSLGALSSNGYVTMVSAGMVHLCRPAATFSGVGEHKVTRSMWELQLEGFDTSDCAVDVAQDLLVYSRKDLNTMCVHLFDTLFALTVIEPS
ncbi:hypothetical protein GSI_03590 [Ganoderma sinense ZZ0214-1]|uniref:F-box domain-containing protein n=1 Tax=Ganoderma sinense ZZ0214-1 TaxID=1077348 RepID=A0A2G8SJC6_9APHY|nr:hypothetical protein GSI_03590 [Ganoderma sinense ZZ0214-1]